MAGGIVSSMRWGRIMVGLPGFEPGSRDPQPRSIGQANLQALSGYSSANLFAQSLADVSGISGEAEGGYIVYQIDMADEHPPATISVE